MADINNIEKRLAKIESKVEGFYRDQVRINNEAYRHVVKLEKRFAKIDKHSKKMKKHTDPRMMERNTMKLVDQALKVYDQKRGKH